VPQAIIDGNTGANERISIYRKIVALVY